MTVIEKITAKGFKSFAKRTELLFGNKFNIVLGPNGVGKSNICDALCFVLGKISAKDMRAEKSANLIYNGGKKNPPAKEAEVSIEFNNSKNTFPIKEKTVKITRIVKNTGQSKYKINNETRTRQQILDLLNTAKINPDGHNIVLQGDIVKIMEIKPLERRKIIEDISGISVFEEKKNKCLNELGKVEEKLKEAEIILTEREANLRELKKDRDQALKYKELEEKIKDNKATYLHMQIKEKEAKKETTDKKLDEQKGKTKKIDSNIDDLRKKITETREEIKNINTELEERGEKEHSELRINIEDYKTEIARAEERINICKNEIEKLNSRKIQLRKDTVDTTSRIKQLKLRQRNIQEKIKTLTEEKTKLNKEISALKIRNITTTDTIPDPAVRKIVNLKEKGIYGTVGDLANIESKHALALEVAAGARIKSIVVENDAIASKCIKLLKESKIGTATFLPLNKIKPRTDSAIKAILKNYQGVEGLAVDLINFDPKFKNIFSYVFGSTIVVNNLENARKIGIGRARMVTLDGTLLETSGAMIGGYRKQGSLGKTGFKFKVVGIETLEKELMSKEKQSIELRSEMKSINMQIENMLVPESDKTEKIIKQQEKEKEQFKNELNTLTEKIKNLKNKLKTSESSEKKFRVDSKSLALKRDKFLEQIQQKESQIIREEEKLKQIENVINNISISRAKYLAELEALNREFEEFKDGKIRRGVDVSELTMQIREFERMLNNIGNVNLRALEVYEEIAKEHKVLVEKASKLKLEKQDVLDMMQEIESNKKDVFMRTYNTINKNFKQIFLNLYQKGEAHFELEDPENIFEAGLEIKVKIARNKFLDIKSLSGGEKTMAALAFIFAIQEYQPSSFYFLDEVDAALDKTNSEILSKLVAKYADKAQYIVISHNDVIITEADQIYGVSMQDGVSKIVSLKI